MYSSRLILLRTVSEASYVLLVLLTIVATGLSCTVLIAQAIRTSPNQSWSKNVNALVIGASYAIVVCLVQQQYIIPQSLPLRQLLVSLLYCGKRRIAVRSKLQRISKSNRALSRSDLPEVRFFLCYRLRFLTMSLCTTRRSTRISIKSMSVHVWFHTSHCRRTLFTRAGAGRVSRFQLCIAPRCEESGGRMCSFHTDCLLCRHKVQWHSIPAGAPGYR